MKTSRSNQISPLPALDLSHLQSVRVLLKSCPNLHIIQVGCGGIGAYLAGSTARIARECVRLFERVHISFFDGDQIEEKNIRRQNFCQSEVGQNKAETLAYRLNAAWGLDIEAVPLHFDGSYHHLGTRNETLTILLGCVDTAAARQTMHRVIADQKLERDGQIWWIDGGNGSVHGQVCVGNTGRADVLAKGFYLPTVCTALPSPGWIHTELLKPPPDEQPRRRPSCADLAIQDPQSLTINMMIAGHMADYLLRLLLTHDLRRFATYLDMNSGSVRSLAITPTVIQRAISDHVPE